MIGLLAFLALLAAADGVTIALVGAIASIIAALISGGFVFYRVVMVDRPQLTLAQIKSVTEDAKVSRDEATAARQEAQRIHESLMRSEDARRVDAVKADATISELRGQVMDLKGAVARLTTEVALWKAAATGGSK
jgi:hypothetical protein